MTVSEKMDLLEFCLFVSHVYVPAWITCPVAADATINDLMLFRRPMQYGEINKVVSQAATTKFSNQTL